MLFMVIETFRGGQAAAKWTGHWSDLIEFEIVPVRTSEQATQAIEPQL